VAKQELVELELVFITDTELAWGVKEDEVDNHIIWLPKQYVERDGSTFTIPEWLAIEKELI
jgi:hypothetical protein